MGVIIDGLLSSAAAGVAEVPEGWGQGRATFGGLVAGLLLARAEALVASDARRLRTATFTFVGPVAPGAATIEAEVLRAGSSATSIAGRLLQDGEVRATVIGVFAQPRATAVEVEADLPAPAIAAPAEVEPVPYIEGITPEFFQHVELRFAAGSPPFSGAAEAAFGGWMRFRQPPDRFGDRELIALTDAWPPAVSPRFSGPAAMSTVSWTIDLLGDADETSDPAAQWQYDVRTIAASDGFAQSTAHVWDAAGRLRARSHQTIAYFGAPAG